MSPVVVTQKDEGRSILAEGLPGLVSALAITDDGLRVQACGQWGLLSWPDLAALVAPPKDIVAAQRAALIAALSSRPGVTVAAGPLPQSEESIW